MNLYGWIFMILSWSTIISMTVYSLMKIINAEEKRVPAQKKKSV